MSFLSVFVLLVLFGFLLWFVSAHKINAPGPPWYPVIGSLFSVLKNADKQHIWALEIVKDAKWKTAAISAPGLIAILQSDPKITEYVLKTNFPNYRKGSFFFNAFEPVLGHGIFNVDGDEWKTTRKVASHMFSHNALKTQMEHVFIEHGETVLRVLDKAAMSGEVIDLQRLFQSFTFDSICEIAFGVNPRAIENGENEFQNAFDQAQSIVVHRLFLPPFVWRFQKLFKLGLEKELPKHIETLNNYIDNIIKKRKEMEEEQKEERRDLLSLNLAYAKRIKDDSLLTPTYLRDLIINFMLAGRDTTGSSLTFFFKTMSELPEQEEKLHKIVDEVITEENIKPSFDFLKNKEELIYLRGMIYESLRLNPPVPSDAVFAVKDDTLPDGTFVPAGAGVSFAPYVINRNPAIWPQPETYKPERWLDETKIDWFKYPTFKAGPRLCLGKDMAIFEIQVLVLLIASRFRFRVLPGQSQEHSGGAVLFLKNGLKAKVEKRKK